MGSILTDRYDEIAQWMEALKVPYHFATPFFGPEHLTPEGPNRPHLPGSSFEGGPKFKYVGAKYWRKITEMGFGSAVTAEGWAGAEDVWQLDQLVIQGEISQAEANAFLTQKYPSQQWSSAKWGGAGDVGEAVASELEASYLEGQEGAPTPEDLAQIANSDELGLGGLPAGGESSIMSGKLVYMDELPEEYDKAEVEEVLEGAMDQISLGMQQLSTGAISFKKGSISGSVIAPGSLPYTAINPLQLQAAISRIPGPDQAIALNTTRSTSIDDWDVSGEDKGPGRVWKVTTPEYPPGWKPSVGPTRYRIVEGAFRAGVSSVGYSAGPTDPDNFYLYTRYGIVIKDIPHNFGRPPVGVMAVISEGDQPVHTQIAASSTPDGPLGGGTIRLFHDRADEEMRTDPMAFMVPFGAAGHLLPTQNEINNRTGGIMATLLVGRDAGEVYRELNSRKPEGNKGVWVEPSQSGPAGTSPWGMAPDPFHASLAPAGAVKWAPNAFTLVHESSTDSDRERLCCGVPFEYDDCASLVATDTKFSLVVQPMGLYHRVQVGAGGLGATWERPAIWHKTGVMTVTDSDRDWAVDVVVF